MKFSKLAYILISILISTPLHSQRVGLVLSGGGAKGCTHVGVIKALEENNIPIDYVTGTSMGAIVGSFYAMGYTPREMEEILTSEIFNTWMKGRVDDKSKFYFKEEEQSPEFISFKMTIDDSLTVRPVIPNSFLSPNQMNQACLYLYTQATTACKGNFDSLFVPFRCVATDLTAKKAHIHKSGDLGDAVRTSMSFPFVFKPIKVNNHLMLDGGVYNNFPIDIMENEFKADYIIGSSVSDNPSTTEGEDPMVLLENLIMQKTNYNIPEEKGTLLDFHYTDISLLNFERARELIKIGYDSTIAHMDEIKAKVKELRSKEELAEKRNRFKQKEPNLIFKDVIIRGVKPQQQKFIKKFFSNDDEYFDFFTFRKNYFKLLSDKKIAEVMPHAQYNETTKAYDLILDVELNDHFKFAVGGNISSTTSNQLYVSAKYLGIRRLSYEFGVDGQIGVIYNNAHAYSRIDFPTQIPLCLKFSGDITRFTYSNKQNAFFEIDIPTKAYSTEFNIKSKIAVPFLLKGEIEAGVAYGKVRNKYHGLYTTEDKEFDRTDYRLGVTLLQYNHNSLSHKQYPIYGTQAKINAQYIFGSKETSVNTPVDSINLAYFNYKTFTSWFKVSAMIDHYAPLGKHFSLGFMAEGAISNHGLENNYMETLLMAPAFAPTKHSMMVFNPAFHANSYIAAGLKPIFRINDFLHIRFENYLYVPHKPITPTALFAATYDKAFSKLYGLSELTVVAQLKYITAGVYGNWYSYPNKNWNVGLNIGYLIFHNKLIE